MSDEIERIRGQVDSGTVWSHCRAEGRALLARIDELEREAEELRTENAAAREVVEAVKAWGQISSKDDHALLMARSRIWDTMRQYKKATDDE